MEHRRVGAGEDDGEDRDQRLEGGGSLEVRTPQPAAPMSPNESCTTANTDEIDERGDRANPEAGGASAHDHGAYNIAMISVRDGQNQILAQISEPTPARAPRRRRARASACSPRICRAPFDVPPTDNSAVDGYAVASDDVPAAGTRDLDVVAELAAGAVFAGVLAPGPGASGS